MSLDKWWHWPAGLVLILVALTVLMAVFFPKMKFVEVNVASNVHPGERIEVQVTVKQLLRGVKGDDFLLSLVMVDNKVEPLGPLVIERSDPETHIANGQWNVKGFSERRRTYTLGVRVPENLPVSASKVCFLATLKPRSNPEDITHGESCSAIARV